MGSFNGHIPECRGKTRELLNDKCSRMESKRKKLLRNQSKEKSQALENRHLDRDLQQFTTVRTSHVSTADGATHTTAHEQKPISFILPPGLPASSDEAQAAAFRTGTAGGRQNR